LNIVDEQKKPLTSVQSAIDVYTKVETVTEGENKVDFCTAENSVAKTKQLTIHSSNYTKWYIITLKRFDYTTGTKLRSPITISPTIQLDGNTFMLQGIILHIGRTMKSGHYIYIVFEDGKPVRELNDTENLPITKARENSIPTDSYILLYKK
jgi:hypothetical protein